MHNNTKTSINQLLTNVIFKIKIKVTMHIEF